MKSFLSASVLLMMIAATVGCSDNAYVTEIEVKILKTADFEPPRWLTITTSGSIGKSTPAASGETADGAFWVYSARQLIHEREGRRAMMVEFNNRPSQVFVLHLASDPGPTDGWTAWRKPDYTESGDPGPAWTFMNKLDSPTRSTDVPADSFQLRYRLSKYPDFFMEKGGRKESTKPN